MRKKHQPGCPCCQPIGCHDFIEHCLKGERTTQIGSTNWDNVDSGKEAYIFDIATPVAVTGGAQVDCDSDPWTCDGCGSIPADVVAGNPAAIRSLDFAACQFRFTATPFGEPEPPYYLCGGQCRGGEPGDWYLNWSLNVRPTPAAGVGAAAVGPWDTCGITFTLAHEFLETASGSVNPTAGGFLGSWVANGLDMHQVCSGGEVTIPNNAWRNYSSPPAFGQPVPCHYTSQPGPIRLRIQ